MSARRLVKSDFHHQTCKGEFAGLPGAGKSTLYRALLENALIKSYPSTLAPDVNLRAFVARFKAAAAPLKRRPNGKSEYTQLVADWETNLMRVFSGISLLDDGLVHSVWRLCLTRGGGIDDKILQLVDRMPVFPLVIYVKPDPRKIPARIWMKNLTEARGAINDEFAAFDPDSPRLTEADALYQSLIDRVGRRPDCRVLTLSNETETDFFNSLSLIRVELAREVAAAPETGTRQQASVAVTASDYLGRKIPGSTALNFANAPGAIAAWLRAPREIKLEYAKKAFAMAKQGQFRRMFLRIQEWASISKWSRARAGDEACGR